MALPKYVACRECDLLHRCTPLPTDGVAHCRRCGAVLYAHRHDRSEQTIAWALAGLILFVIANAFPVLSVVVQGSATQATLLGSVRELFAQSRPVVGTVVLITGFAAPLIRLGGVLYVLLPGRFGRVPPDMSRVLRLMQVSRPWNMISIFLLGVLVSLTKLSALADVVLGPGLAAMAALIVVLAATDASFDPEPLWSNIEPVSG